MAEYKKEEEQTASWDAQEVRRAQEEQRRRNASGKKHRKMSKGMARYLLFVLIVSAVLAETGWLLGSDLCGFNKDYQEVTIEVTSQDTLRTVAKKLDKAGLIRYQWFFRFYAGLTDAQEDIGMGTYQLNTDMDYNAMIHGMHNASGNLNAATVKITIPEGYTVRQIIKLLADKGVSTEESLLDAAKNATFNYAYIDNNSHELSRLEGFLFPDTYEFYKNEKPSSALNRLLSTFESRMDGERMEQVKNSKYDLKTILTVASLIEKETDGTDQSKIASVIYNRLEGPGDKAGTYGLLQVDASLLYALPEDHEGPITNEDKELDSKYNLYKNKGLPPTPIANPGTKAIDAALNPETTDYYYYALGKEGGEKRHRFFTNYQDHMNFVNSSEFCEQ